MKRPLNKRFWLWVALIASTLVVLGLAAEWGVRRAIYASLHPHEYVAREPLDGIGSLSAAQCSGCHATIASEWKGSKHAGAHTNPLYQADVRAHDNQYFCNHCHAPLTEQQPQIATNIRELRPLLKPEATPNPRFDAALQHEGVTCAGCHQAEGAMLGPFVATNAPHPTRQTDELRSAEFCGKCHEFSMELISDFRRPILNTLGEWRRYRELGGDRVCVDCHMPKAEQRPVGAGGPKRAARSHALRGPADVAFLKTAYALKITSVKRTSTERVQLRVELANLTGHRLPTGDPHRSVELLARVGTLPPARYVARRVVDLDERYEPPDSDTTLLPRETRAITLDVPAEADTTTVTLDVRYVRWLAEDPVAKASGEPAERLAWIAETRSVPVP